MSTTQEQTYDQIYSQLQVPFPDHKIEGRHELRGKVIVSIGGGAGADVAHLARDNEVHVIDYSSASAPAARAFGLHPLTADLNAADLKLPFQPASVDVIVLKDILEHLIEPEKLLKASLTYLKPDGYLVISIPNHLNLWGRLRILFGGNLLWKGILHDHSKEYSEWNYMHIRFFTWDGFKRLLESNGLSITERFFDFGPLAHYFSIPMYLEHLSLKKEKAPLPPKSQVFLTIAGPVYRILNGLFPAALRSAICGLAPSLLTSGFYVHARRKSR